MERYPFPRQNSAWIDNLQHNIIENKPSLVGLNANIKELSGIVIKNVFSKELVMYGDILFTHFGISGPTVLSASAHLKGACTISLDLKPALD
jgi:predicted flavoprotein YhiN